MSIPESRNFSTVKPLSKKYTLKNGELTFFDIGYMILATSVSTITMALFVGFLFQNLLAGFVVGTISFFVFAVVFAFFFLYSKIDLEMNIPLTPFKVMIQKNFVGDMFYDETISEKNIEMLSVFCKEGSNIFRDMERDNIINE